MKHRTFLTGTLIFILNFQITVSDITWTQVFQPSSFKPIVCLGAANSGTVYAAGNFQSYGDGTVFKTKNNGQSWYTCYYVNGTITDLVIENRNKIYLGTLVGLYESTVTDSNWLYSPLDEAVSVLFVNDSVVMASIYPYLRYYRSLDDGMTWVEMLNGIQNTICRSFIADSSGNIYAGTDNGFYRTSNYGDLWEFRGEKPDFIRSCCVSKDGSILLGTTSAIYKSTNGCQSWFITSALDYCEAFVINKNDIIFAGIDNGIICSSDNGTSWYSETNGIESNKIMSLTISENGFVFAGTWSGKIFRTSVSTIAVNMISSEVPLDYSLSQNFPNPFNPYTKIKFNIPARSFVRLVIFDAIGRAVKEIVNEKLDPGKYETEWFAEGNTSGVYFCSLIADGTVIDAKKFILLK